MSLHFAASRTGNDALLARALTYTPPRRSANDNGRPLGELMAEQQVLRTALLHFAKFGLRAADTAREQAETARRLGDDDGFRHWLAVCRQLDRRLARGLEAKTSQRR